MKKVTLMLLTAATMCTQVFAQNKVKNLYTSMEKLNLSALEEKDFDVQLNRTLLAGYNTICLPYTLNASQLAASAKDVQVEKLVSVRQEGNTLYMYFLDCTKEGIKAGMPYLIYSPTTQMLRAKSSEADAISTELKSVSMSDGKGNRVTFGSSWESLRVDGRYGIPAQQEALILESVLIRTEGDKSFLPTRCGFTWDEQMPTATNLEIKHVTSLAGTETSIEKLQAQDAVVDVYNVSGQIVQKNVNVNKAMETLPSGIYVIGGAKVAVK
ncbi:MAG: T9SS type A sorting domain-containing protein [Bacteroidaceae bacterium]|nr:T9SS type A sorting domain-containing protein [Bacteroidaceae bacterium]